MFVGSPLEADALYDEQYYTGEGIDTSVNYAQESAEPDRTIRWFEFEGIHGLVRKHLATGSALRWLDYGCGTGALLRFVQSHDPCLIAEGFDASSAARSLAGDGTVHLVSAIDLETHRTQFYDVVTAIEVLEHIEYPLPALRTIAKVLKPGGMFFQTTGNRGSLAARCLGARWSYLLPEIHISIFNREAMVFALESAGLEPRFLPYDRHWAGVLKFKTLKGLGRTSRAPWMEASPWTCVTWVMNRLYGINRLPMAVKPAPVRSQP